MNDGEKNFMTEAKGTPKAPAVKKEHQKYRGKRFTAIDFTVIIVVLLAIVGIGFRGMIADLIVRGTPDETVSVSVKIDNVTSEQLSLMKTGDSLYLDGVLLATLSEFSYKSGTRIIEQTDASGTVSFVEVEDPKSYTVFAEMQFTGNYTENGFVCLDHVNLYVGKILNITSSSYSITVIITEIPRK